MNHHHNLVRIKAVNDLLGDLRDKFVFVGGATVSLYSDRMAMEVRPTDDIDILIELLSYTEYAALEEKLRAIGFVNDIESGVICRYKIQGIIVDVMPTSEDPLGFSNKWYPDGHKNAIDYVIDETNIVKIFSAPYFIASKLEAFKGRGKNDGRTSTDFEDIVFVFENRSTIWSELTNTSNELQQYFKYEFKQLLNNIFFEEWIDSHVDRGSPPATYIIIEELKKFTA